MKVFSLIMLVAICTLSTQAQTVSENDSIQPVCTNPDVLPEFPDGQGALMQYLARVTYPPFARENDSEGTVYVQFIIEKDGTISDVKVARTSGHKVQDDAALEHVKAMPQWKPGYKYDQPVRVQYVVPVKFKLS